VQSTVQEVVAERFERERPALKPLPAVRFDTSYYELRKVSWDCYINVAGNRYSVPADLAGQRVAVRIGLDGSLRVYHQDNLVVRHSLRSRQEGWVTLPEHHQPLWQETLRVEQRPLSVYEEVS
jgi:hypothetical protein